VRPQLCALFTLFVLLFSPGAATSQTTDTEIDNLEAFARLAGYLQYFHPTDAASEADWQSVIATNAERVIDIESPDALAEELNAIFAPYAPTVQIYTGDAPAPVAPPDEATDVLMNVHIVIGDEEQGNYDKATPITIRMPADEPLPETTTLTIDHPISQSIETGIEVPVPQQSYTVRLTEDVNVQIPLLVYADENQTLPESTLPDLPEVSMTGRQYAAVIEMWNHYRHFWSYWNDFENDLEADWNQALRDALTAVREGQELDEFYITLRRLNGVIPDSHSTVSHPRFSPLGDYQVPFRADVIQEQLMVVLTDEGETDLQPGDIITTIDDRPAMDYVDERTELFGYIGDYARFGAIREIFSGIRGGTLELGINPVEGDPYTTTVRFSEELSPTSVRENRPPVIAELSPGVYYLDITRADEVDVEALIPVLAEAETLIFDQRGYPTTRVIRPLLTHLADEPLDQTFVYLPVIAMPDHEATQLIPISTNNGTPAEPAFTDNVAFLMNGNEAVSAAETVLTFVTGADLGQTFGSRSSGGNGNIITPTLAGQFRFLYSGLYATLLDGTPVTGTGIEPDVPVERTREGVANLQDEVLRTAYESLTGNSADEMIIRPLDISVSGSAAAPTEPAPDESITLVDYRVAPFSTQVPQSWEQRGENPAVFASGDNRFVILTADTMTALEETLEMQLGRLPEEVDTLETEHLTWSIRAIQTSQAGGGIGIAEADNQIIAIVLVTPPDAYDRLYETLLIPALEATRVQQP
jgi:hypothetical protein